MAYWTENDGREALATISSLKRALGIANQAARPDEFVDHDLHVYTPDHDSATLIADLLWQYANGKRAAFYDAQPGVLTIRDTIRLQPLDEGGYEVSMNISHAPSLTKALQKMIDKQIAPDQSFTR